MLKKHYCERETFSKVGAPWSFAPLSSFPLYAATGAGLCHDLKDDPVCAHRRMTTTGRIWQYMETLSFKFLYLITCYHKSYKKSPLESTAKINKVNICISNYYKLLSAISNVISMNSIATINIIAPTN